MSTLAAGLPARLRRLFSPRRALAFAVGVAASAGLTRPRAGARASTGHADRTGGPTTALAGTAAARVDELLGQVAALEARLKSVEHNLKLPQYLYHSPIDYDLESHAPAYGAARHVPGEPFPLPPAEARPGYAPDDDALYLEWGRSDHDLIVEIIGRHYGLREGLEILDFGCSSGRVLRHFHPQMQQGRWKAHGVDIQAYLVEWMRRHFPPDFNIHCGTTFPHLPFRDSSLDVIFGISVFTHTKYLWDAWLAEFRRVLKPGGLCLQSVQCEAAWDYYHRNRNVDWVRAGHPASMLDKPAIDEDFFFFGDAFVSQTFYREATVKRYWGRYMQVVDFLPPPKFSYQNWIVLKNVAP